MLFLGGGFKYLLFSPRSDRGNDPIWRAYPSKGVGEKPPTRFGWLWRLGWSLAFNWLCLNFSSRWEKKGPVKTLRNWPEGNSWVGLAYKYRSCLNLRKEKYASPKQWLNAYLYPKNIMIQDESKIYNSFKTIVQILVNVAFSSDF